MGLIFPQALDFAGNDQVFILAKRDAVLSSKTLRPFGDKIDVRAFAQDLAGGANRIAQALNTTDASGTERAAVHDERVHLHLAVTVQKTAAAGVEGFVVFHDDNRFFHRVERRAATFEHTPSGSQRVADAAEVRVHHVVGNRPRPTVDDQNRIAWQRSALAGICAV